MTRQKMESGFDSLENQDTRYVIVTNLDPSIDDYDLREKFSKFGHVPSVSMDFQPEAGNHGKCAKLEFALAPAARAACSKIGGKMWRNKRVQAFTFDRWKRLQSRLTGRAPVNSRQAIPVRNKVFVGGLGNHIDVHTLRSYFQNFGPLDFQQTKIINNRAGKSKGYGFVVFRNEVHAQNVLAQSMHWIQNYQVNVGPVHEPVPLSPTAGTPPNQTKKDSRSRSRSYDKETGDSGTKSGSRSRSRSPDKKTEEMVQPILGEPEETVEEDIDEETYQKEVERQAAQIEEKEKKALTLEERRRARRAKWKKRAEAKSPQ